jgi:hypothetical protein
MASNLRGRTRIPDLHPDDAAARLRLGVALVVARQTAGLTRPAFGAQVGRAKGSIQKLEGRGYWTVGTLQWWARGLQLRFGWTIRDLPPLQPDVLADVYAAKTTGRPELVDAYARAALVNDMRRARIAAGLTLEQLAARLGVSTDSVIRAERVEDNLDIASAQRHIRGCGGSLDLHLHPVPVVSVAA